MRPSYHHDRSVPNGGSCGFGLVEVVIALALSAALCGGLMAVGLMARRSAEYNRVSTEARALSKERLEEMVALGLDNLKQTTCTALCCDTNTSSRGYPILRRPQVIWHEAGGGVVTSTNAAYAEVHIDAVFPVTFRDGMVTNRFSMLVQ